MKKAIGTILTLIICLAAVSQPPEGFRYQATVRDNIGNPLMNQAVSFRFTIIQGTPTGADVFQETHNLITDDFGSVSLVINNGTGKVGSFENIDWGSDIFFLKVEIDKTGGSAYSDMGTSQLLSVPYSLHAKTSSDKFSGDYNDLTNKPVTDGSETKLTAGALMTIAGTGTIADPYIVINGFSGSYNDLTNKPVTDGSETRITAGDNIVFTGTGTAANPYVINERKHYVGESYGGGIVFYVYDNGRHGLIASTSDQDVSVGWSNGVDRYTNTTGNGIKSGEMNTYLIIAQQTDDNPLGNFAAKVCADFSVVINGESYGDWYLPSKLELTYMFLNKDLIGGFTNNYYWSSTEFSSITAWTQSMTDGSFHNLRKNTPYSVRAIRAF